MYSLDDSNFLLYAASNYCNPSCFCTEDFYEDLKKFKYVKRLFNRFKESKDLKERLILNHLVILYNVFGTEAATRMLFFKLDGYYTYLKPFLLLLSFCPDSVVNIKGKTIITDEIIMDPDIVARLRTI